VTYKIAGLPREAFEHYFALSSRELERADARRVIADADRGFPCRVSLEDARQGESLILLNFTSHAVANPYRTAYAIYIREQAPQPRPWIDCLPPVFAGRSLSLRGFDAEGMLIDARLTVPGEVEEGIHDLFGNARISCIHAHNAAYGCFAARIERHGDGMWT
jgi:hypothetical protein